MYILKQHSNDDGIAVVSSSVNNKDLLSFLCYRSRHMEINSEPVSSVEFPNILATDVVHDYTDKPLFYKMDIPGFSFNSKDELYASISITTFNGYTVDTDNYKLSGDDTTITIYTNLKGAYYVNYNPYPYSGLNRSSSFLLSTVSTLTESVDYTVSANGGMYTLSDSYYVTNDEDRSSVFEMLYSASDDEPWFVHVNPLNLNGVRISREFSSYTINTFARKLYGNLFVVDAKDISDITCNDHDIQSFNNCGYLVIETDDDNIEVQVTISTYRPMIKEGALPVDFRPYVLKCGQYDIRYDSGAYINYTGGFSIGNVIVSSPAEGSYYVQATGKTGLSTDDDVPRWDNARFSFEDVYSGIIIKPSNQEEYDVLCSMADNEDSPLNTIKIAGKPIVIYFNNEYKLF